MHVLSYPDKLFLIFRTSKSVNRQSVCTRLTLSQLWSLKNPSQVVPEQHKIRKPTGLKLQKGRSGNATQKIWQYNIKRKFVVSWSLVVLAPNYLKLERFSFIEAFPTLRNLNNLFSIAIFLYSWISWMIFW